MVTDARPMGTHVVPSQSCVRSKVIHWGEEVKKKERKRSYFTDSETKSAHSAGPIWSSLVSIITEAASVNQVSGQDTQHQCERGGGGEWPLPAAATAGHSSGCSSPERGTSCTSSRTPATTPTTSSYSRPVAPLLTSLGGSTCWDKTIHPNHSNK